MLMKMPGTYCPLCGNMGLIAVKVRGKVWVYCPMGATGIKDAHTAYEYKGSSVPVEFVPGGVAPTKEAPIKKVIDVVMKEVADEGDLEDGDEN